MNKDKLLVTRESIAEMLENDNPVYVQRVIGRALVGLFQYQTEAEKSCNDAVVDNGVGFAGCDAKSGCLTAKYFMKHGKLLDWQVEKWTKIGRGGYPRLSKYWKQLNYIANRKLESV